MKTGPSPNLSWNELSCKDGTPYPDKFVNDKRVFRLAEVFEGIRKIYGMPIIIFSAYRTPSHNRLVGGARNSMHLEGKALDLKPPKGISLESFYKMIKNRALELGIHGIGKYKTFVHVDIRPTKTITHWFGIGMKDSK